MRSGYHESLHLFKFILLKLKAYTGLYYIHLKYKYKSLKHIILRNNYYSIFDSINSIYISGNIMEK